MTDRELLQFAAKAAGIEFSWLGRGARLDRKPGVMQPYVPWNPLENDGDALRLAVKLEIQNGYSELSGCGFAAYGRGSFDCHEYGPEDPCRATRRVITRAAAEIGKALP